MKAIPETGDPWVDPLWDEDDAGWDLPAAPSAPIPWPDERFQLSAAPAAEEVEPT